LSTSSQEVGDGETLPSNLMTWMDLAAYLDWSGLRPMSELEYEKICRGPNTAVTNEYAWGTTNIYSTTYTLSNRGLSNEGIYDPGAATGNAAYYNTTPGGTSNIIVRCGAIAASVTSTRQETGAGYYGVMEMSGNVHEMLVSAQTNSGLSYTGIHGDGNLTSAGDADEDYWPGINGHTNYYVSNFTFFGTYGVTAAAGAGARGGDVNSSNLINYLETSERSRCRMLVNPARYIHYGGRGVRTAD